MLRTIETWIRARRTAVWKSLFAGRRGRKLLLDAMPDNVTEMTIELSDHRLSVPAFDVITRHVFSTGDYTRSSVAAVCAILERNGKLGAGRTTLLEIGANIGTHTVYLAKTGLFDRILAIEPDPRNLVFLSRNVELNDLGGMVTVAACAAGETEGRLMLRRVYGNSGNAGFMHDADTGDGVEVAVRPVDAIMKDKGIAPESVALVWMDIEGFEPVAMRSMSALVERKVPIYLEFSPKFYGPEGTSGFAEWLAARYARCIVFEKGRQRETHPRELATLTRQCDVLLLD